MELFLNTATICANALFIFMLYQGYRESLRNVDFTRKELNALIASREEILNQIKSYHSEGFYGDLFYDPDDTEEIGVRPKRITIEQKEAKIKNELKFLKQRLDELAWLPKLKFQRIRFIVSLLVFTIVYLTIYCISCLDI
jgi:hypothetical protein